MGKESLWKLYDWTYLIDKSLFIVYNKTNHPKSYGTIMKYNQFGLITITKEKLRRSSFSSKHLEYLSYGLPVLTPEWRQDILLKDVSIYFNEDNFLGLIKKYSNPERWQQMSDACYRQAKLWKWENVLKPLGEIVNKSSVK